jgi:maltose alpha-D-glucosyltransferase / alpha-amylase
MLGDREHEELAYSVMFSLPGAPVIRFGDELRMGDNLELEGRDAVRTPMHWADERNAGFSTRRRLVHPVIDEGVWSYRHVNVAAQRRDPDSFLNWMARMIRLRKECPEIGWGRCRVIDSPHPGVLVMRYAWRGNTVLTVHNFARAARGGGAECRRDRRTVCPTCMQQEELKADDDGVLRIRLDRAGLPLVQAGRARLRGATGAGRGLGVSAAAGSTSRRTRR